MIRVFSTDDWQLLGEISGRMPTLQNDTGVPGTTRVFYVTRHNDVEVALVYRQDGYVLMEEQYFRSETYERSLDTF